MILHFGILALVFVTFLRGGFRFDEFTTSVAIIVPMFAGYTTAIVVYFSKNRFRIDDKSQDITAVYAIMSTAFPLTLFVALSASVLLFATSEVFKNFEEFKGTLTLLETVFSAYVAKFVYTLFEKVSPTEKQASESSDK